MSDSFAICTVACQAPLSMGFPKQEYWSRLPFPSPGGRREVGLSFPWEGKGCHFLPNPGIEPTSPALADGFFTTEPPGKPDIGLKDIETKVQGQESDWPQVLHSQYSNSGQISPEHQHTRLSTNRGHSHSKTPELLQENRAVLESETGPRILGLLVFMGWVM